MVTLERVREVKKKHEAELMKKSGVVGVAIGYKYIDDRKTNQLCIVCYVVEKKKEKDLKTEDIIPEEIEGVPIDVVESGRIRAF
jgi:argonaute-like protein implicated in RNA metabolism and viral defense